MSKKLTVGHMLSTHQEMVQKESTLKSLLMI